MELLGSLIYLRASDVAFSLPRARKPFFTKAHIGEFGQIAWTDEIEICSDTAYLEITGQYSRQLAHA